MEFGRLLEIVGAELVLETRLLLAGKIRHCAGSPRTSRVRDDLKDFLDGVRPFLESSRDAELLTRENVERVLLGAHRR